MINGLNTNKKGRAMGQPCFGYAQHKSVRGSIVSGFGLNSEG
jgi:hypothetical protein